MRAARRVVEKDIPLLAGRSKAALAQTLHGKVNVIPDAVRKQYSVCEADAQNAGVFVLKIGMAVVDPGSKGLFQHVSDLFVLL